jgi:hypothetical protein
VIGSLFPTADLWAPGVHPVSRQASAENPTGGQGTGCAWDPDPTDPELVHSGPAMDLGRGYKVRPYVPLAAGGTLTLLDADGPGVVTRLFITSNLPDYGALRLRCHWDRDPVPAVDVPLGSFFVIGHSGPAYEVSSLPVVVGPARGCSSYWPMPFGAHARITLTNTGPVDAPIVAYSVAYALGELRDPATHHFHAMYRQTRTSAAVPDHVVLDRTGGAGAYVGTAVAWTAREPGWWGEGEVKVFLDSDSEYPTMIDTGTEDYFGGAWGFGRDATHSPGPGLIERPYSSPYMGAPLVETDESRERRISLYRWHLADPVHYAHAIRVTVQALGWGDDRRYQVRDDVVASVAYHYERATS